MNFYLIPRCFRSSCLRGLIILIACIRGAFAADIYLTSNGNDLNGGESQSHPVATLQRAVELALTQSRTADSQVSILVQPGKYMGQSVVINGNSLKGKMTIAGQATDPLDFPIFSGDGSSKTWLVLKGRGGQDTGLTIQGLKISNYITAISLDGNRDDPQAYNAGTVIRRNVFTNIGSISTNEDVSSTAAIRFVNSKRNFVENNYFRSIKNKKACGGLHSVYAAHFSSDNQIVNNVFDDACGSVIKLRDRSNNNIIENNQFKRIFKAPAVQEWFCDMLARKDCTKKLGECPSTGNVLHGNKLTDSNDSEMISVVGESTPREWCQREDFIRERISVR